MGRIAVEGIGDIDLGILVRPVEVAAAHLRAADPELSESALRQPLSLGINHIQMQVVHRLADGDVLLTLLQPVGSGEDGTFRGTIDIIELESLRRGHGSQLLTAGGEVAEGFVMEACGELITHLGGHERVGDAIGLEIVVQIRQVQAKIFRNDMHGGTRSKGRVHIHHTGVEAVARIGGNCVFGLQLVIALIPVAEGHEVAVLQLTALGNAGGA